MARPRKSRAVIYALIFLLALVLVIAFFPLRVAFSLAALDDSSLTAENINGSIWNGHLNGAHIGPVALGDLDAGVQPAALLTGQILLDLSRDANGDDPGLRATIGKQGQRLMVQDAYAKLPIARQLAPLPASHIELDGVNISFVGEKCESASGAVRLSLDANIPGLDLRGGLRGDAACENGVLVLPLSSGRDTEKLTVTLQGNGFYTAQLLLTSEQRIWTMLLPTLGFQRVDNGYAIKVAGQLKREKSE